MKRRLLTDRRYVPYNDAQDVKPFDNEKITMSCLKKM